MGDGISGVVGEPGGGKSRVNLMRFLTLEGKLETSCFLRRRKRNRMSQPTSRKPRAELKAMATLVLMASCVSGVAAVVDALDDEASVVSAAVRPLLLAAGIVSMPLCVARMVLSHVEVGAGAGIPGTTPADIVCAGSWMLVHRPTDPSPLLAPVVHV